LSDRRGKEVTVSEEGHELEGQSSTLNRSDLLRRVGAAAFAVSMFGGLPDKALGVYGPLRFKNKQLSGELKILQWAHFIPPYDPWLDGTYVKQWGEKNDVEVKIDHINNALLFATGTSEVAGQSGHDLFQFLNPPSSFQKQVVPLNDIVQEVTKKLGPMTRVAKRSTYNPRTKKFFGFPDNYAPDPVTYRKSVLQEAGVSLRTWEDVRKGAAKLKAAGHPVGFGMSTGDLDSNMFLISLLYCYGGFIQNEENRIVIGQGSNRKGAIEALKLMQDIYKNGMSDEVFAWNTASNNQGFLAGRLSVVLNAISIPRVAELNNSPIQDDTWLASIPRGPVMRMGNEHVMGVYVIWKFAKNKEAAKQYLVDAQLNYRTHFLHSEYYNFPGWNGAIKGGFKTMRKLAASDSHKPRGKYSILTTIAEKYTTNVGYPGYSNAVIDEIFNTYLIPQMFAQVAQGKLAPADAVKGFDSAAKKIYSKWKSQGLV
jgi:multiple sugar transport system substrate-binding protein